MIQFEYHTGRRIIEEEKVVPKGFEVTISTQGNFSEGNFLEKLIFDPDLQGNLENYLPSSWLESMAENSIK